MVKMPKTLEDARTLHKDVTSPVDVNRLLTAAEVALAEQRIEDAETLVAGALVASPDRVDGWRLAGAVARESGEIDEAETAYRQALELHDDEEVALELASLLASDGRFEEAEGMASALALHSESRSIRELAERLASAVKDRRSRAS